MNRTELKEFFANAESKDKVCKLTYYAAAGKSVFFVRTLDQDGKPIQKRHPVSGALMFSGNKPIYAEQREEFSPIVTTRSAKADALSFKTVESDNSGHFTDYQKEMIAVLEEAADNGSSPVQRESEYKEKRNPEAFAQEQELEKLRAEHGAKVEKAYETGKAEAATEIEKLKARLADAEKEISELTEPTGKPHKGGKNN